MRTTIDIPDELLAQLRAEAKCQRRSLSEVVVEDLTRTRSQRSWFVSESTGLMVLSAEGRPAPTFDESRELYFDMED